MLPSGSGKNIILKQNLLKMRIALFSDVHANLPALNACLDKIDQLNPDAVYCLGDLVGYNVWPNEVVNEIRRRKIPTIAGNYDFGIGRNIDECGCAYKTDNEKAMGKISISFTNSVMHEEQRKYLRTLPAHIKVEFQLQEEKLNLLLVHGSPRKINEYLFEDREEKSFLRMMQDADAHILCFGHTHKPFHRIIQTGEGNFLHAVNLGSVGKPKDGNPRGSFVMLELDEQSSLKIADSVNVTFIRFDYDIEKAAKAVEESVLPNDYAEMLRNGI
jgi:putative phosphoesterase